MGLANFAIPEGGKVVNIFSPQHCGALTGDYVSLKGYHKAYFIISWDGIAQANTQDFHLYGAPIVSGVGGAVDQIMYNYWSIQGTQAALLLTDTLTKGASGVTVFTTTVSLAGMLIIEVDPADYSALGFDCFTIHADASNAGNFMSCVAILIPGRYQEANPPSAIVD